MKYSLLVAIIFISIINSNARNLIVGDSLMIFERYMGNRCYNKYDTFKLNQNVDKELTERTWFLDQFKSTLNDSISYLFVWGMITVHLKFLQDLRFNCSDEFYGLGGAYRISQDNRVLILGSGSNAMYHEISSLNYSYQAFWRSIHSILHESKYRVCGDTLFLFFQSGNALFLDSSKVTNNYLLAKKLRKTEKSKVSAKSIDDMIKNEMQRGEKKH